ncbi:hypothetical protein LCGC14_2999600, partial [marine sediment metagenome]
EQILAAGLAADAILLAAQAKGYGGILLTGKPAYDPVVKAAFGLADKAAIVGFVFLGGLAAPPRAKRRTDPAGDEISRWQVAHRTVDYQPLPATPGLCRAVWWGRIGAHAEAAIAFRDL